MQTGRAPVPLSLRNRQPSLGKSEEEPRHLQHLLSATHWGTQGDLGWAGLGWAGVSLGEDTGPRV